MCTVNINRGGVCPGPLEERTPPRPLHLEEILASNGSAAQLSNGDVQHAAASSNGGAAATGESACKALGLTDAHRVWDISENTQVCAFESARDDSVHC